LVPAEVQAVGAGAGLDLRVLLFVLAVSLATGLAFGLVPAWQSSHADPNAMLKNATPAARTLFGRLRVSDLLVVAQVALALTLVVGAGLLIRSLQQLVRVPSGVRPERRDGPALRLQRQHDALLPGGTASSQAWGVSAGQHPLGES
jgi:hypothetical protein